MHPCPDTCTASPTVNILRHSCTFVLKAGEHTDTHYHPVSVAELMVHSVRFEKYESKRHSWFLPFSFLHFPFSSRQWSLNSCKTHMDSTRVFPEYDLYWISWNFFFTPVFFLASTTLKLPPKLPSCLRSCRHSPNPQQMCSLHAIGVLHSWVHGFWLNFKAKFNHFPWTTFL